MTTALAAAQQALLAGRRCRICGKPIPGRRTYCRRARCRAEAKEHSRKRRIIEQARERIEQAEWEPGQAAE